MSLYTDQACVLRDATAICVWILIYEILGSPIIGFTGSAVWLGHAAICVWILIYEILGSPIIGFTGSAVWLGHAAGTCWRQDLSGQ